MLQEWGFYCLAVLIAIATLYLRRLIGSYASRVADLTARADNLPLILAEVQAVTETQKQIESSISHRAWMTQQAYELKKEAYQQLFRQLAEYLYVNESHRSLSSRAAAMSDGSFAAAYGADWEKMADASVDVVRRIRLESYVYLVVLGPQVYALIRRADETATEAGMRGDLDEATRIYRDLLDGVSEIARHDLGLIDGENASTEGH